PSAATELEEKTSQESEFTLDIIGMEAMEVELPADASFDPLSIDMALHLIAQGKAELLSPYLDALLQRVRPLLDFSSQVRRNNSGQHADDKT
ncbi:MAG: hypothetical protein AAB304_02320, partial [Pseudomonadota bacterium]